MFYLYCTLDAFSFSKMVLQKEELEQKHLHLVQIVESEKTAKWQYGQQCEELTIEIKKLRAEASVTYFLNNVIDHLTHATGIFLLLLPSSSLAMTLSDSTLLLVGL